MKLILLYGPPAVGKLTVAKELAKLTGITLFHNHMFLNEIVEIFGFDNPVRRKLEFEFKLRIIEEAAVQNKDLIITGQPNSVNAALYERLFKAVREKDGEIVMVRLKADMATLLARVSDVGREEKLDDPEKLKDYLDKHPESLEKFFDGDQLEVGTSDTSPQDVAHQIIKHINL